MSDYFEQLRTALIDRYVIEREIGSGGMATVYLAEDLKHDRQVAVEVLNPELSSLVGSTRFLREIEIAARLNHPHALRVTQQVASALVYAHREGVIHRDISRKTSCCTRVVGSRRQIR